jgi:hypothetical protein
MSQHSMTANAVVFFSIVKDRLVQLFICIALSIYLSIANGDDLQIAANILNKQLGVGLRANNK